MKKQRLSITISKSVYDAIEQFSQSMGQTKSDTINQLMEAAVPSLQGMARFNFAARNMSADELERLKSNLEKVGEYATGSADKAASAVIRLADRTPI